MTDSQAPNEIVHGEYAGFFSRAAAYVIDALIIAGVLSLIWLIVDRLIQRLPLWQWLGLEPLPQPVVVAAGAVFAILFDLVYYCGFWLLAGRTPGKQAMGLLVVRTDGQPVRLGAALRRWIGYYLSAILLLGYLWVLVDDRRQAFHDKLAGTLVVYSWPKEIGLMATRPIIERLRRGPHAR